MGNRLLRLKETTSPPWLYQPPETGSQNEAGIQWPIGPPKPATLEPKVLEIGANIKPFPGPLPNQDFEGRLKRNHCFPLPGPSQNGIRFLSTSGA